MAMGRQGARQGELMVMWSEMPRSPGHVFYDRLQEVLLGAALDGFVEEACRAYYAKTMGAPSVPPGRYSTCTWSGISRGSTASAGSSGAARNHSRCASSSAWRRLTGFRTIPGCRRRGAVCPMRRTSGLRLGSGLDRRTRAGAGRAHRRGCLNHGGQCGPAGDRARDTGEGYRAS